MLFKVGDFSKLSQVTVRTLRHYDEIGLLKPVQVDKFSGYRYYSANQLTRLRRILALKDMGLSLDQIALLLDKSLSAAEIRGMLKMKQVELRDQIAESQARLEKVEIWLKQLDREVLMPEQVVIKKVEALRVAALRDVTESYASAGKLFDELYAYLGQHKVQAGMPCMVIFYDTEYRERDVDQEVAVPIEANLPQSARIKVRELAAIETAISIIHHGAWTDLGQTYGYLMDWIQKSDYQISGPNRELYLRGSVGEDPATYLTEIQFPVEKVTANVAG